MKRKRLIPLLAGLFLMGAALPVSAVNATAEKKDFTDDFKDYNFETVDSARYTLQGDGYFMSNSAEMKIGYGAAKEQNGLFINISDVAAPGEKVAVSYSYKNGNGQTETPSIVSFYCDEKEIATEAATEATTSSKAVTLQNEILTVPDYTSSAYLYLKSSVTRAFYDDLKIMRIDENAYFPEGAKVEKLTEAQYTGMTHTTLFEDACAGYKDVNKIPTNRFAVDGEGAAFKSDEYALNVFLSSQANHGLRVHIEDKINAMKAGDSFYLTFGYQCNNGQTPSTIAGKLMINGAECASEVLETNVHSTDHGGIGQKVTLYAKVTLPSNLPETVYDAYLLLEATKVDTALFSKIVISQKAPFEAQGANIEKLDQSAYEALQKVNVLANGGNGEDHTNVPERYWVWLQEDETTGYVAGSNNGFVEPDAGGLKISYAASNKDGNAKYLHGLCVNVKDLIGDSNVKAGGDFYITYYYGCQNQSTGSDAKLNLMVDGVKVATQALASDLKGTGTNNTTVYAKVTLPTNLPKYPEEIYLMLEGTNIDRADYKDITISVPKSAPENTLLVSEPTLNVADDTASITVTNTTGKEVTLLVANSGAATKAARTSEAVTLPYSFKVPDGTVNQEYTFAAKASDKITITNTTDSTNMEILYKQFELKQLHWVGTWGTAVMEANADKLPKAPLANSTLRQIVRISTGGEKFRLKISNQYGSTALALKSVHIAPTVETTGKEDGASYASSQIEADKDTTVTFDGMEFVSVAPGEVAVSDPISYTAEDIDRITITMQLGSVPAKVTFHDGSRTTSYLKAGGAIDAANMDDCDEQFDHWYFIASIDVQKEPEYGAIVCLGDSITDGRGVTTNKDDRWTDVFAERLKADTGTEKLSVLNMGIGGNAVVGGSLGPRAVDRFDRDVLGQEGAKYLIILEGINDINSDKIKTEELKNKLKDDLIAAYKGFIQQAHKNGFEKVYGVTITPFGNGEPKEGAQYNPYTKALRNEINEWIRTTSAENGGYDGYIDFDSVARKENNPEEIQESFQNDHLHPTPALYQKMGKSIDLKLFGGTATGEGGVTP